MLMWLKEGHRMADGEVTIIPNTMGEKQLEKIIENVVINVQKRDYRATMVQRTEQGDVPSDVSTFVHIDEENKDELGNPLELDIKGTITPMEAMLFKDVNYSIALASLRDWWYIEDVISHPDGTEKKIKVPVNLAQIDMLSKKRLNMSVFGTQSNKHISALRAASGMPLPESNMQKAAGWFGWRKEKVPKEELDNIYGKK